MKWLFFILSLFSIISLNAQLSPPIGEWQEYLPYNSAIDVTAGNNKVYCATPYSLFSVDIKDNSIERFSRITGLSETGISCIQYDNTNNKLFIAYSNSNIDIIYQNDIYNVPYIKRNNIAGDKNIYNIFPYGNNYYLSTGLGVIIIDGNKYEVKDSWFIGSNGNQVKINGFTSDNTFFYAATDEGLKKANINSPNLADYTNWQLLSGANGLSAAACKNVFSIQNKIIVQVNDSLLVLNGNSWNLFYADGWPVISSNLSSNQILLCERQLSGISKVTILNADGTIARTLVQPPAISFPRKAILFQDDPWIADQYGCLSHFFSSTYEEYIPNSPEAIASGEMTVHNNIFYTTAGEVNDAWNYQYNGNGIYILKEGEWNNINRYRFSQIDSLLDYITIAVDPRDESVYAGSYGGGLLHIKPDQTFEIFKQNSLIGPTVGDPTSYRVAGLDFDNNNNLWISNFGSGQPLIVKKADGTWKNFSVPLLLNLNAMAQIIIDDNNFLWIVSPLGNGLIGYDHGASIDNTNDDRWKLFGTGSGNGNLPSADVSCVAKDKNGFIWIGTNNGIGVIQCPQDIFSPQACDAIWPVVPQGSFAGYLFSGVQVQSIAVDGADRKWVATNNGVFLISPDGTNVIYQFTQDNSPLLSNDVKKIAINGTTGEVFFATTNGICSFRSTATEGGTTNSGVLVFPNPVPPGFTGSIGIRGLVDNAIIKITELDGRLVYQTRALGGQATWDGKDYNGQRISSGVYLVLVSDDGRTEKIATKIVFISR